MKRKKISPLLVLSFGLGLCMLFFTFFQWGWFAGIKGFEAYLEIPVNSKKEGLDFVSDIIWMAAPFSLLAGLFIFYFGGKKFRPAGTFFACLPLTLYSFFQILLFLGEKEGHFSLVITYFLLILWGCLTMASTFYPELRRFAAELTIAHAGVEILLLLLSFVLEKKLSQFYFFQMLLIGRQSVYHYSFFVISVFLYYLFYLFSVLCLLLASKKVPLSGSTPVSPAKERLEEAICAEAESSQETEPEEETEAQYLSLEDFGIEK